MTEFKTNIFLNRKDNGKENKQILTKDSKYILFYSILLILSIQKFRSEYNYRE